jgi:hypothetical protein
MNGTATVMAAIRAAEDRGVRMLVAGGVVFSLFLAWLLLALFPGTGEGSVLPADLVRALRSHDDPTLIALYLVSAGTLLWATWSALGGAVLRSVIQTIRGEPVPVAEALTFAIRHWTSFFLVPLLFVFLAGAGTGLVYVLASLTRVPGVGWPAFLLLSPVAIVVAWLVVTFVVRYGIGGHLAGPAIATGDAGAFAALNRVGSFVRRAPVAIFLRHLLALLLVVLHSAWRIVVGLASLALVYVFVKSENVTDLEFLCASLILVVAAAWLVAWPFSLLIGARAGLYLFFRRELDGVEVAAAPSDPERAKSLEELGFELVELLLKEEE